MVLASCRMNAIQVLILLSVALVALSMGAIPTIRRAGMPHQAVRNRTALVDTRIGSGGFGFGIGELNPGPSMPFGCLRLGPDTSIGIEPIRIPFQSYAGYAYEANWLECFSHTHVVGAGEGDFQNFGVTVARQWHSDVVRNAGYKSLYSHTQEVALPGYYAVELLSHNTYAELTVSGTHAAMHRYWCRSQWPSVEDAPCVLILDVCHGFNAGIADDTHQCKEAQVFNVSSTDGGLTFEVDAYVLMAGSFGRRGPLGGIQIYLHMEVTAASVLSDETLSPVAMSAGTWENGTINNTTLFTQPTTSGSLGVGLRVPSSNRTTQFSVRSGLSFVSSSNARLNLNAQQRDAQDAWLSFESATQVAVDAWEELLAAVTYDGGVAEDNWHRAVFDATMYRAHLAPSTYSEANGAFLGQDMKVHRVNDTARHLSDLSIWDIFRTQTPMLLWTRPDIALDLTTSMLESYAITHNLPKWIFANVETDSMVGYHSAVILAEYAVKQLGGAVDPDAILNVLVEGLRGQNQNLVPYGFVPQQATQQGASNTQDYAIDAAAVVYLANALGNASVAQAFEPYANAYKLVFDNASTFFCPRWANGTFQCPDPLLTYPFENTYTEGDAWQYNWYVPQDPRGLVALFPSPSAFADKLFDFFELAYLWPLNNTMPNPYFWAGNEPDIQAPPMFNWAGKEYAYLTSLVFPKLLDTYYIPYASGVPGDDDYGALSAMAFWGYVGIFPMVPSSEYALFAPRFDKIDFTLDAAGLAVSPWRRTRTTTPSTRTTIVSIRCSGRPTTGIAYVANVTLNGAPLATPIVTHDQLLAPSANDGSVALLAFTLSGEPSVFGELPPSLGGPAVYEVRRRRHYEASPADAHLPGRDEADVAAAMQLRRAKKLRGNHQTAAP